jgi:hypothetical protein
VAAPSVADFRFAVELDLPPPALLMLSFAFPFALAFVPALVSAATTTAAVTVGSSLSLSWCRDLGTRRASSSSPDELQMSSSS